MGKRDAPANPHKGHRENVRRRYIKGGLEVFAPHEILELLLYYAIPQKDTNPLAHRLIDAYGALPRVLSAPVSELETIEGVGERTAILLSLVFQIGRRIRLENARRAGVNFFSTKEAGEYLTALFSGRKHKAVYELCLNQRGDLVTCYDMANGDILSVSTDIRALVKNVLFCQSSCVIIAHNHTDGGEWPTPDDYAAAKRIAEAFDNVGVKLFDHIVVGKGEYVSLREQGILR